MNKRIYMGMAACVAMLSLSGSVRAEQQDSVSSIQSMANTTAFWFDYLQTEETVYAYDAANKLLMYLDSGSMTWYPLCDRPDCEHIVDLTQLEIQSDCNAYIDYTVSSGLMQYGERIYYASYCYTIEPGIQVESINMDGTDHREELWLAAESGVILSCQLYEGNVYQTEYTSEDPFRVYRYELNQKEQDPVLILEENDVSMPVFLNHKIYYEHLDYEKETSDFYRINLDGSDQELLLEEVPWITSYIREEGLYQYSPGEGLLFRPYQTDEVQILWEETGYEEEFFFCYDEQYAYLISGSREDGIFYQGESSILLIFNWNGQLLEKVIMPDIQETVEVRRNLIQEAIKNKETVPRQAQEENMQSTISFYGSSSKYLFVTDSTIPNYYLERSAIGTGTCEWKPMQIEGPHGDWFEERMESNTNGK